MLRFTYSAHKTRAAAESALEHYFANGEVSECEWPMIVARGGKYLVTLGA